ncbi:riboflavin biosynthesis protein RibF [Bombilactobacillus thymidiniphilus]|uniref:Riboflavin biosynthesis protein n=1 Tax=Bombilactobacillus thymidiniphilus TaxID=2923363 RepID=A0ABY4PDB7_9LACO|nr:riboflavin biosynthesis protein RibF [Bombilactobacillus thymidiniphilus]UQS83506.1 riboflavin biosynthesis protein RibF [Bombilactobacillus thymidiniphilus]
MQVEFLCYPNLDAADLTTPKVLAAGFFDGVHLGHKNVIQTAIRLARSKNQVAAVLTFDRHPATVFGQYPPDKIFQYLTPLARKLEIFEQLGVDIVYIAEFNDQFMKLPPKKFINDFLIKLGLTTLVAGYDWTFGPKAVATMDYLRQLAQGRFQICQVPELIYEKNKVSSTNIRNYLKEGEITAANLMLSYNYRNQGVVVHGAKMGRQLGYPTANLAVGADQLLPRIGVYVTRVLVAGKWYPAMTSIGRNITFKRGDNPLTVEANLLNFERDLYGQELTIEWLYYLRDEIKFADATGLMDQLAVDQQSTEKYFGKK